ncbi:molybdopterin molybdotransferase MoeA [Pacificoceanicola onchidii]|uniref:molybdopterin molybdotransferase MoeA n=1 Tax=Pacificoceanicola onchidii TaxID=2562685 RepID=UPI0010A344BA|nr:molybdopterin molybdotransferase MoeA [Pacificoceanicola onchidii]
MREQSLRQAGFCGCGHDDTGSALMTVDEALDMMSAAITPIRRTERVSLAQAVGRVLAQDVRAVADAPPFDNSAVDGYAICHEDIPQGDWIVLTVSERVVAGSRPRRAVTGKTAIQVMTGAPLPAGTTAVVMQEDVTCSGNRIVLRSLPKHGSNMRQRSEDIKQGDAVLKAGTRLTARAIAVAAAAGAQDLVVRAPLRVGLLVTGSEVTSDGNPRPDAAIWDVNSPVLMAAFSRCDLELVQAKVVSDHALSIQTAMSDLAANVDLLVTTGGVSVGEEDHVKPGFEAMGGEIVFSGVAIKPGKPVTVGRTRDAVWLGLPGNPQAAYLMWHLFGNAACDLLAIGAIRQRKRRCVVLDEDLHHKPGRCELRLAKASGLDGFGRERVRFGRATFSGRVGAMASADGVIVIPAETEALPKGALVEMHSFDQY